MQSARRGEITLRPRRAGWGNAKSGERQKNCSEEQKKTDKDAGIEERGLRVESLFHDFS
jgi:hypothetical protein